MRKRLAGVEGRRAVHSQMCLPQREEGGCSAPHGDPRLSNIAPPGGQVGGNLPPVDAERLADAVQLALYRVGDGLTDDQGRLTRLGDVLRRVADELHIILFGALKK